MFLDKIVRAFGINARVNNPMAQGLGVRSVRLRVDGYPSDRGLPNNGVPQGSFLGPLIFLLHTTDIAIGLENLYLMFAGGIRLLRTANSEAIHRDLDRFQQWSVVCDLPLDLIRCHGNRSNLPSVHGSAWASGTDGIKSRSKRTRYSRECGLLT